MICILPFDHQNKEIPHTVQQPSGLIKMVPLLKQPVLRQRKLHRNYSTAEELGQDLLNINSSRIINHSQINKGSYTDTLICI